MLLKTDLQSPPALPLAARQLMSPREIRESLGAERLRDFHEGRRLLVVDDNSRSLQRLQSDLAELYAQVDAAESAAKARQLIMAAAADGRPYDALVLDLYMPGESGVELLKSLADRVPAVVINTASMMAPVVADLSGQMAHYQSCSAQKLLAAAGAAALSQGLAIVPVLLHHKFDALPRLVDKLDYAMLLQSRATPDLAAFLKDFNPLLIPAAYSAEVVHHFCEEVHNLALESTRAKELLLKEYGLGDSRWWQANRELIEESLAKLLEVRFRNTYLETPSLTSNRLHEILFHVEGVAPLSGAELERESPQLNEALGGSVDFCAWHGAYRAGRNKLKALRQSLEDYHQKDFDFDAFINLLELNSRSVSYADESDRGRFRMPDPDRFIRDLLLRLAQAFKERWAANDQAAEGLYATFVREEQLCDDYDNPYARKLAAINCGSYYSLRFSDNCGQPLEQSLAALLPTLTELQRRGLGIWIAEEGRRSFFEVYLKVTEKTRDFAKEAAEAARKKEDGIFIIPHGPKVYEDLGPNASLVAVGILPSGSERNWRSALLYRWEDKIVFAVGDSHVNAAAAITQYMAYKIQQRGEDAKRWQERGAANFVYQKGTRLNRNHYNGEITIEVGKFGSEPSWAKDTLVALGVNAADLRFGCLSEKPNYR